MRNGSDREDGGVSLGVLATLLAIAALIAAPLVLMTMRQGESAREAVGQIDEASETVAQLDLTSALRAAQTYFAQHGSLEGFDALTASSIEPGVRFNASATAVPGEVSIRSAGPASVVLVTASVPGAPLCIAVLGGGEMRGRVDAPTPAECTGGW